MQIDAQYQAKASQRGGSLESPGAQQDSAGHRQAGEQSRHSQCGRLHWRARDLITSTIARQPVSGLWRSRQTEGQGAVRPNEPDIRRTGMRLSTRPPNNWHSPAAGGSPRSKGPEPIPWWSQRPACHSQSCPRHRHHRVVDTAGGQRVGSFHPGQHFAQNQRTKRRAAAGGPVDVGGNPDAPLSMPRRIGWLLLPRCDHAARALHSVLAVMVDPCLPQDLPANPRSHSLTVPTESTEVGLVFRLKAWAAVRIPTIGARNRRSRRMLHLVIRRSRNRVNDDDQVGRIQAFKTRNIFAVNTGLIVPSSDRSRTTPCTRCRGAPPESAPAGHHLLGAVFLVPLISTMRLLRLVPFEPWKMSRSWHRGRAGQPHETRQTFLASAMERMVLAPAPAAEDGRPL